MTVVTSQTSISDDDRFKRVITFLYLLVVLTLLPAKMCNMFKLCGLNTMAGKNLLTRLPCYFHTDILTYSLRSTKQKVPIIFTLVNIIKER